MRANGKPPCLSDPRSEALPNFSSETPRGYKTATSRAQSVSRPFVTPSLGSSWLPPRLCIITPASSLMPMKDPSIGSTRCHSSSKDFSPIRPARQPIRWRLLTYGLYLVSALLSAACVTLYARRGYVIPNAYALCSPSGVKAIYTVNPARPLVQCIVVNGSRIQDMGSLGRFTSFSRIR